MLFAESMFLGRLWVLGVWGVWVCDGGAGRVSVGRSFWPG